MSIDRVWIETDHKCIIWCNQLVRYKFYWILNYQFSRQTSRVLIEYAKNAFKFMENAKSNFDYFYNGAGVLLHSINLNQTIISLNECSPQVKIICLYLHFLVSFKGIVII